jgi:26S proteasome regulatory subunit N5
LTAVDKKFALEGAILFLLLSKHCSSQQAMLKTILSTFASDFKSFNLAEPFKQVLELFSTAEIIVTPFDGQSLLESHASLRRFSETQPDVTLAFVTQFHNRIIEHNLRVVAKYYKQITFPRLQQLTNLSVDMLESHLSGLSFTGDLLLKIDRPAGVVSFQDKKSAEQILTAWSGDISKLLALMESTCHLINRENMVHKG